MKIVKRVWFDRVELVTRRRNDDGRMWYAALYVGNHSFTWMR